MTSISRTFNLEIKDISAIFGSISITCWLVVFLPQLVENIRRRSTHGLSVRFVSIWLCGDVCNVLGSVLQGVLPTMIILAIYYACVDILLLCQIFYYSGFTWNEEIYASSNIDHESSPLLPTTHSACEQNSPHLSIAHLSPAVPFVPDPRSTINLPTLKNNNSLKLLAIPPVILVGILGWYLIVSGTTEPDQSKIVFSPLGQTFGYFSATLYLSSRIPQLLLNYRRKSVEGVSLLFFLFACIGNLTYVLSILFFKPRCLSEGNSCSPGEMWRLYGRHIAVNSSWLAGSAGTILLDIGISTQFWLYGHLESDK